MTRVPPIVFPALALLGVIVAALGLALDWSEVAPIGFFILVFCTILATIQRSIHAMEPYQPPATPSDAEEAPQAASDTTETPPASDEGSARIYDVADEPAEATPDRTA